MAGVFQEFQQQLAVLAQEYSGKPEKELTKLFLLALEREQIVSVGYRPSLILSRFEGTSLPQNIRNIISHALSWTWKDEEMHAIYIRGHLLQVGSFPLKVQAFLAQASGAIGGWAGSVRQHARWQDAPFSSLAAFGLTSAGMIAGKVPQHVRKHLSSSSFRDFCLFNVDAEQTAWLCWQRLTELARITPGLAAGVAVDFERIADDEMRHAKLFEILAAAFDDQNNLQDCESDKSLIAKIAEVNEAFIPRSHRTVPVEENPLGTGGRVHVIEGKDKDEKITLFRRLLEQSKLESHLHSRAQMLSKDSKDIKIAIKTTFMMGYHHKDKSTLTDPELLEELSRFLNELGFKSIFVVEGPNIYDKFYKNRTVRNVAEYFSISSPFYQLVDVSEEQIDHSFIRGLAQYSVSKTWKEADFRISFAKMRSHPVELALLTVGNIEGLGKRCEEFLFVERQAHREVAVMTLLSDFPPHFAIIDAYDSVPDGLLGVMGSPRPKSVKRFYAGQDAFAVDTVAGNHIGIKSAHQSSLLQAAQHWFGDPDMKVEVIGTQEPVKDWRSPYYNEFSALLSFLAYPVYVLGSGRGALFVPEMDEKSFPPVAPPSFWLRAGRQFLQALLGLRFPKNSSKELSKDGP